MSVLAQLERLSPERFLALYTALESQGFGPLDGEVAKALRFRPQAIRKLPMEQRARQARRILERGGNAELCYELFGTYLMKARKGLVTGFLDATGVPHEEGMLESLEQEPERAKLRAAVEELDGRFPPEDVTLYLSMAAQQWPAVGEIGELWRERAGQPARA